MLRVGRGLLRAGAGSDSEGGTSCAPAVWQWAGSRGGGGASCWPGGGVCLVPVLSLAKGPRSAADPSLLDYPDKPLEKPLKLVLKVGGSEVTELSGSGHDSSYYDDRSDHERERHREKKKKKKKKAEKEKHLDDEERRKRKVGDGVLGEGGCCWRSSESRRPPQAGALQSPLCRRSGSASVRRSTGTPKQKLTCLTQGRKWRWSHPQTGQSEPAAHSQVTAGSSHCV